jgi:hypothetical protein
MTHLQLARLVRPAGSALFFLGTVAPDAVRGWHEKDASHFRDLTDRMPALSALARETAGDFAEGALLHFYLDWRWDTTYLRAYQQRAGNGWFASYREEIAQAGSWAFHRASWAAEIWAAMEDVPLRDYGVTRGAAAEEVRAFLERNHRWHRENCIGPSGAFPPEMTEAFLARTAVEYVLWREAAAE